MDVENSPIVDVFLYISYFLIAVAIISSIFLPLIKSLSNPKSLLTIGGGIVALIVIFFIAFALSDSNMDPSYATYDVNPTSSRFIGAALITFYILFALSLLGIAYTEVAKYLK